MTTHDDAALTDVWARYKAGQCEWSEVQAAQDRLMPRCAAHNTPTGVTFTTIVAGKRTLIPVCARCLEDAKTSRALFVASRRLIDGGIWLREE
jgi:hypothetical protein